MMSRKLKIILFVIRNLRKFLRFCAVLIEEWYKFEKCKNDEVGVL